jgi:hypothetical protein
MAARTGAVRDADGEHRPVSAGVRPATKALKQSVFTRQDCLSTDSLGSVSPPFPAPCEGHERSLREWGLGPDLLSSLKSARTTAIESELERYRSPLAGSPPTSP